MRNQLKPDKTVVVVCVCLGEVFFYPTTAERTENREEEEEEAPPPSKDKRPLF